MRRAIQCLLLLLLLAACKSSPQGGHTRDVVVSEWSDVKVPGAKMYTTHLVNPPADYDNRGSYLVLDGDTRQIGGKDAMKVVREKGISDPTQLAILAQLFLDSIGGSLVTTAEEAQGDPAAPHVAPPAIHDNVLEYWHWTGGMAHSVMRSRVDLTTWEREEESWQTIETNADPIGVAQTWLAGNSVSMGSSALDLLVRNCDKPGAAKLIDEALLTSKAQGVRSQAAWSLRDCHDDGSIPALIKAVQTDGDTEVRWKAANTLGELHATDAIPALTQAMDGPDENLRYAAQRAIEKIKGGK